MSRKKSFDEYYDFFKQDKSNDKVTETLEVSKVIDAANDTIVEQEEEQKRNLRGKSFKLIAWLIWVQLFFFDTVVILIIASVIFNNSIFNKLDHDTTNMLLSFLKYFIGATIVELLGMLSFVIRFVFSKYNKTSKKQNP